MTEISNSTFNIAAGRDPTKKASQSTLLAKWEGTIGYAPVVELAPWDLVRESQQTGMAAGGGLRQREFWR